MAAASPGAGGAQRTIYSTVESQAGCVSRKGHTHHMGIAISFLDDDLHSGRGAWIGRPVVANVVEYPQYSAKQAPEVSAYQSGYIVFSVFDL